MPTLSSTLLGLLHRIAAAGTPVEDITARLEARSAEASRRPNFLQPTAVCAPSAIRPNKLRLHACADNGFLLR